MRMEGEADRVSLVVKKRLFKTHSDSVISNTLQSWSCDHLLLSLSQLCEILDTNLA